MRLKFNEESALRFQKLLSLLSKEIDKGSKYVNLAFPRYNSKREFENWEIGLYEVVNVREKSILFYKIANLVGSNKYYLKSVAIKDIGNAYVITNSNVFTLKEDINADSVDIKKELERRINNND